MTTARAETMGLRAKWYEICAATSCSLRPSGPTTVISLCALVSPHHLLCWKLCDVTPIIDTLSTGTIFIWLALFCAIGHVWYHRKDASEPHPDAGWTEKPDVVTTSDGDVEVVSFNNTDVKPETRASSHI